MSKEDLMKERFKVIADYPNSIYSVGEVIQQTGQGFFNTTFFEKYPNIFKKLEWWEEREEKDMPEYVNFKGAVFKQMGIKRYAIYREHKDVDVMVWNDQGYGPIAKDCLPSTEAEYLEYRKKLDNL